MGRGYPYEEIESPKDLLYTIPSIGIAHVIVLGFEKETLDTQVELFRMYFKDSGVRMPFVIVHTQAQSLDEYTEEKYMLKGFSLSE